MSQADKRTEILHATLELIAEHGFHGAPMATLARRAGVGAGTIYRYFENKDVLIAELYGELEARIRPVLAAGYPEGRPVRERFLHLGQALLGYFIRHPLDFRYLEQFHNSPYGIELRRAKLFGEADRQNLYRELFAAGVAGGQIKNLPLPVLFGLAFGPLFSVARDHILGFLQLDTELIRVTVESSWDAVSAAA